MQVKIYEGEMLVGTATVEHLDPPMGVAFGPFSPTPDYAAHAHANAIEGEFVSDKGTSLAATADLHGFLDASIALEDWSAPEIGKQLTLFFKDGEKFAALFAEHADYRAYYPQRADGSQPPKAAAPLSPPRRPQPAPATGAGMPPPATVA